MSTSPRPRPTTPRPHVTPRQVAAALAAATVDRIARPERRDR